AGLAFSPDGSKLYVLVASVDKVFVVGTASWQVLESYPIEADALHPGEWSPGAFVPGEMMRVSDDGDYLSIITPAGIQLIDLNLVVQPTYDGGPGDDIIVGSGGADTMTGSGGNDTLSGGNGNDNISGGDGNDWLSGGSGSDTLTGDAGSDTFYFGASFQSGTDQIADLSAGDTIQLDTAVFTALTPGALSPAAFHEGSAADTADQRIIYNSATGQILYDPDGTGAAGAAVIATVTPGTPLSAATIVAVANGQTTVESDVSYTLAPDELNLILTGSAAINGTGNALNNEITGNDADNQLSGLGGNDTLSGNGGNDYLDGGAGNDTMVGGTGNDTYVVDSIDDTITELAGEGTDTVVSSRDIFLRDNFENATLTGFAFSAIGNAQANILTGNAMVNVLAGDDDNDWLFGLGGNDSLQGDAGNDLLDGGDGIDAAGYDRAPAGVTVSLAIAGAEDTGGGGIDTLVSIEILGGSPFGDSLTAGTSGGTLFGFGGNDFLFGGAGIDSLDGGQGGDVYVIGSAADHGAAEIVDRGFDGTDEVRFAALTAGTLTMFAGDTGIEQIVVGTGTGASAVTTGTTALNVDASAVGNWLTIIGNDGANIITGTAFADTLSGNAGADQLVGGSGDDILDGGTGDDTLDGGDGLDTADYSLAASGIDVDLSVAGPQNTGGSGTDTLISIENLTGSAFGDTLSGNSADNVLLGGDGNDTLLATGGSDALYGGLGDDVYIVVDDIVSLGIVEYSGEGHDIVLSPLGFFLPDEVEDLTLTGSADAPGFGNALANVITGNFGNNDLHGQGGNDLLSGLAGADTLWGDDGNDTLNGGAGNDLLDGGVGNDVMAGGAGDDFYRVDGAGDQVTELAGEGTDTVESSISYVLGANFENLTLTGFAGLNATGNELDNVLIGNAGDNVLSGLDGNDTLEGSWGNDRFEGGTGSDTASYAHAAIGVTATLKISFLSQLTNVGADTFISIENLTGSAFGDFLIGNDGANILSGLAGDDTLEGAGGDDTLYGGDGVDTASYASATAGVTASLAVVGIQNTVGAGIDMLFDIENLTGSAFNDTLTGNAADNVIEGGAGNDVIDGGAGVDTAAYSAAESGVTVSLAVLAPQNTGGAGTDTLVAIANLSGSAFNDMLTGDASANMLSGLAGNDVLNGGAGADVMAGGLGDDRFYIDNSADLIVEAAGEGDDIAFVLGTYTLAQGVSVETLYALNQLSTDPLVLTGNEYGQSLYGNLGDNYLNGGQGADYLVGLAGNDSLLGGTGADHLAGGGGNDVYYVDEIGDIIFENAGEGSDIVVATASFALTPGAEVETLSADPNAGDLNLTGNEFAQSLYGNGGHNVLTGLGGADYMVGGAGNDFYYVDTSDFIDEQVGGGDDWIFVASSYTLREGNEIETLVAVNQDSLDPVNFSGNEFGQSLYGSQGANQLDGGAGNDYLVGLGGNDFLIGGAGNDNLQGGTGNDLYYVDGGDQIFETAGEGDDLAVALQSFTLGAGQSVETLTAAEGGAAINLTGNALGQSIYGNASANVLTSGGGADYMVGGGGNDRFVLTNAPGLATVGDYAAGDVVDISQYLSVANGTDVVAGGYVKIVGAQLMVDLNGGGDGFVTVGNVSGSGSVTIRYQSGGSPTDVGVARSAGQTEAIVAKTALGGDELDAQATLDHAPVLDDWHGLGDSSLDGPFDPIAHHLDLPGII
ncbi:MAG TPA: hypothetical protein VF079_00095, partial [Sphingomicrobium sp.]